MPRFGRGLEGARGCRYAKPVTSTVPKFQVTALARKYRVILALRRGLTPHSADALRKLSREFPGALRELDGLTIEALEARLAEVEQVLAGGPEQPWLELMCRYHRLMRAALAVKRRLGGERAPSSSVIAAIGAELAEGCGEFPPGFIRAVAAPPQGRLNAVIFALLASAERPLDLVESTLFGRATQERAAASRAVTGS